MRGTHLYRTKLDFVERGEGGPGGESPAGRSGGRGPSPEFFRGVSLSKHGRRVTTKCNFTAATQAKKERFFCLFHIKSYIFA